jgi:hypothetical protein
MMAVISRGSYGTWVNLVVDAFEDEAGRDALEDARCSMAVRSTDLPVNAG